MNKCVLRKVNIPFPGSDLGGIKKYDGINALKNE